MKIFLDVGAHIGQTLEIALEDKYNFEKIFFGPIKEAFFCFYLAESD